jgi:hypothetical protein
MVARRDALLHDLRDGKVAFLHHADLTGIDPRIEDVERFANEQLGKDVIPLKNSLASMAYIGHLAGVMRSDLESRGWARVNVSVLCDADRVSVLGTPPGAAFAIRTD